MSKKPRLKRDWEGRYVRLLRSMVTKGGTMFEAGEVLRVAVNRGGLTLDGLRTCPRCESRYRRRAIIKVNEDDVFLLPPDFVPDCPPLLPDDWVAVCDEIARWMEGPGGPLEREWENTDVGHFEDVEWSFEETIEAIRDGDEHVAGYDEPESVKMYRRLLSLLRGIDREGSE